MFVLLASLMLAAAGEVPPPPAFIADAEVVRYLKPAEAKEWELYMRMTEQGQQRTQVGTSILNSANIPRGKTGGVVETPEHIKARGAGIIAEGNAKILQALPSLNRLRASATARQLDSIKTINTTEELAQTLWSNAINLSAFRMAKLAREGGYKEVHLVGSMTILEDENIIRTPALTDSIRAAWLKADAAKLLAHTPDAGYSYGVPSGGEGAPSLAKGLKTASSIRQVALVWAEVYPLASDNSAALLMVRLADAYSMRLIGSEVFLTTTGPADAFPKVYIGSMFLKDQRSFIPRLTASGDWLLSYDRTNSALSNALLRHFCVRLGNVGVGASSSVTAIIGGDAPGLDGARASWKTAPEKGPALSHSFIVTATLNGAATTEVGQLGLKVEEPVKPSTK